MPRIKRKRVIVESDSEEEVLNPRRSSLRVNLSYTSNVSDPGGSDSDYVSLRKTITENDETSEDQNEDIVRTVKKRKTKNTVIDDIATPASAANVTVIDVADRKVSKKRPSKRSQHSVSAMNEKEQQLSKSCTELKNAILNKTQSLQDSELSKRTSEILIGHCSNDKRANKDNGEDISTNVRVSFGKNDQIVMTGCGKEQNPVSISSMSKNNPSEKNNNDKVSQHNDHDSSDCSQSIASTPKKPNIETSIDKSTGKTSKQIMKVPVARLFSDNNPDNSMSEMNPVQSLVNVRSNISKEREGNQNSHVPRISNELNNTVSPILSQGTRKSRISRLSLKKKLTTNTSSRASTNTTNESFINRLPLTCSSFIERPNRTSNETNVDQHTKTVILEETSESTKNQKTINLDDNENNTNTINIDHTSSRSSMEITTISARTPIVRKSFQQIIKKSFRFDTADIPGNMTQKSTSPNEKSINANESSIKKTSKVNSANTENRKVCQDNCSDTAERTSLDVNTSLDEVSLSERVMQKENKKLSDAKQLVDQASENDTVKDGETLSKMRSSLRVNTSLDSVRKSSDNSKTDIEQEAIQRVQLQPVSANNNQEKEGTETRLNRASNGTVRSSMHMNTSLDSVQKSPNTQEPLNYNKILSMVEEASSTTNSENVDLQFQSPEDDSGTENLSLMERIQIKSASKNKKTVHEQESSKETTVQTGKAKNKSTPIRKPNQPEPSCTTTEVSKVSEESNVKRKSSRTSKANSTRRDSGESSIVEPTPFPASRSLLFKTIIRNNMAINTLNARRLEDSSDDESDGNQSTHSKKKNSSSNKPNSVPENREPLSDDTVIVNTSDESSNELYKEKERVVIDESLNDTGNQNKSKINKSRKSRKRRESRISDSTDDEEENKKINKRKLYPLRENSQISFSPAEISQLPRESVPKDIKRKKRRKITQKKQKNAEKVNPEPVEESDHSENEVSIQKPEKKKKKPRKIKSKKIVVKKVTNMTLLDNMLENDGGISSTNERSSLREFDLRKVRANARKDRSSTNYKRVIVVTGHDKDDRDLVKNVVKGLGSAILQANVTPRTTHVISSGVRTINLLKGIIRGCWLLTLEWALKSLESEKWLDPAPFEMAHFAKAVKVNRRDRELFGKAYVPELFITCGPIYIEHGTTPPASSLKELVKTAGGTITEDPNVAKIIVGLEGLKENWVLDSITTGEIQLVDQYKRS